MPVTLRGMTWDHRRAVRPLLGTASLFRARHPDIEVEWSTRPLSGFEFAPVDSLAGEYDLIVLDHPFMGEVAASRSLLPLDDILATCGDRFVGPSLETYHMGGMLWSVPVDAACQVAVSRPDLMQAVGASPPAVWADVVALGETSRRKGLCLAVGLKGVHGLMTFFTLMANLGAPCGLQPGSDFADSAVAREVLRLMRQLLAFCPTQVLDWNSIALHDQMMARDDLVYCPAVYCYATYAEADNRRPLRFHGLAGPNGHGGSAIGGAGLGVSALGRHRDAALTYARFAAEASAQMAFASHHGQPARLEAWEDNAINARFGGCYRETRSTIEASWIRPRHRGYLRFQAEGGNLIETHLRGDIAETALLGKLAESYARSFR